VSFIERQCAPHLASVTPAPGQASKRAQNAPAVVPPSEVSTRLCTTRTSERRQTTLQEFEKGAPSSPRSRRHPWRQRRSTWRSPTRCHRRGV
jgi:hypothetical protein